MNRRFLVAIGLVVMSVMCVSAQSKIIFGGLSLPNGDFGEDDLAKNVFYGGKEGGAATGFNVGLKYLQPFSDPNLNWFVSAELFYNGFTSDLKDEVEDTYNLEYVNYNSYFNVPVIGGVNYSVASLSPDVSLWVEGGIGVNCRIISDYSEETNTGTEYEYDYESSFCFAYQFGGGLKIKNNLLVGLSYYNLGSDKVRGEMSTKGNAQSDQKTKTKKELSTTLLAVRVGYIF